MNPLFYFKKKKIYTEKPNLIFYLKWTTLKERHFNSDKYKFAYTNITFFISLIITQSNQQFETVYWYFKKITIYTVNLTVWHSIVNNKLNESSIYESFNKSNNICFMCLDYIIICNIKKWNKYFSYNHIHTNKSNIFVCMLVLNLIDGSY